MAIIFGYFQYFNYEYLITNIIPELIGAVFFIIINIFIIKSAKTNLEEKENPEFLFNIGLINIIFLIVPFLIPIYSTGGLTEIEEIIVIIYIIFFGLVRSLPFLITYGIMMFKFGKLNQQRFNIYLKLSGIFWIVSNGFNTITLDTYILSLLFAYTPFPGSLLTPFMMISTIFGFVGLIGWIFFLIHAIKNKDNHLLIAGILYFVAFVIGIVYSSFIPYLLGY